MTEVDPEHPEHPAHLADPAVLRLFVGLVEHGSFSRAATALGISRPRLSRTMTDFEAALGYQLFARDVEGLALSDAGRQLLANAPVIIAEDDERRRILAEQAAAPVTLRISFVPGVTITKWSRGWEERHPEIALDVAAGVPDSAQTDALRQGSADVSFVRFPVDGDGLNIIPLYRELAVVVVPKEHPVSLFEAVTVAELAGEHLLQDPDAVPEWRDVATEIEAGTRRPLPPMRTTEDALELVAAGVGILIVPQSVARLHARKDLIYRPISDVAETQIAVAWRVGDDSELVEEFIGIVRGRTAQSSRSQKPADAATAAAASTPPRAPRPKGGAPRPSRPAPKKGKRRGSR